MDVSGLRQRVEGTLGQDGGRTRLGNLREGHRKRYSGPDQSGGDKGMRSIEWIGIKGHGNAIPWPCPMEISFIYVYSP